MTLRSLDVEIEVCSVGDNRSLVENSVDGSVDHSVNSLFQSSAGHSVVVGSLDQTRAIAIRE